VPTQLSQTFHETAHYSYLIMPKTHTHTHKAKWIYNGTTSNPVSGPKLSVAFAN